MTSLRGVTSIPKIQRTPSYRFRCALTEYLLTLNNPYTSSRRFPDHALEKVELSVNYKYSTVVYHTAASCNSRTRHPARIAVLFPALYITGYNLVVQVSCNGFAAEHVLVAT